MNMRTIALAFAVAALALPAATEANAYSRALRNACGADFASLCPKYKEGSPQLRSCFQSNRKRLSSDCVEALVKAGEVPARYLKR